MIAEPVHDRVVDALGNRTYPFGLELGAGDGALTERLAPRCGRLITLEASAGAARRARRRLERAPNVDVRVGRAPEDLPEWSFDLVCSSVLHRCAPGALDTLLAALEASMPRAGTLLVVSPGSAGRVRDTLRARPGLVRVHGESHGDHLIDRFERR